jgi:FtsP/CotA-like multicopper oxidase with cupredoxin domain
MITRRDWFAHAAALAGGAALAKTALGQTAPEADPHAAHRHHGAAPPAVPVKAGSTPDRPVTRIAQTPAATVAEVRRLRRELGYTPVTTPNGRSLPFRSKREGGRLVKEFHLVAEPIRQEFAPGMVVNAWGYNGSTPGPTIEAVEGDHLRLFVTNRLPEPTSVHWHGILLPNGMDGVAGLLQPAIAPGETHVYEFTLRQWGTYMYHPHADEMVQMALGMMGFLVVHPKEQGSEPAVDRDFCLFPHMWFVDPGSATPDPSVMLDFNTFTFNGRAFPGTEPLVCRLGERVRVRVANVSMTSHPIHIHGVSTWVTQTDGGPIPRSAWWPETSIDVPTGTTRAFEFVADNPGDWPLHCHKTHHAMNAMGHDVPNLIGVDTSGVDGKLAGLVDGYMTMGTTGMSEHSAMAGMMPGVQNTLPMMAGDGPYGPIEMGGMFTVIKVREGIDNYADPGWYEQPEGTRVRVADADEIPPEWRGEP